ncbi:glyoxalase [Paucilactobacillus hokkaidonensis JCM 18461]|uniref:Glyoxalase n=2 Tax=Paucilactobacillus hokkaidonensis TaxID=1193095 RepID=A0A0A1GZ46_9LACO|nr:VOC family protein [Paucilactobacillus hokkaidonensis]BAP86269.1 glyoxalase [Paucilactobacillus hokkaidonensis JCM 18461]
MKKMVFVNLPVSDMQRSINFYEALGFKQNKDFSDENGAGMMWDDSIWIMLLTHDFYRTFLRDHQLADTTKVSGSLTAFSMESIDAVKEFAQIAKDNGGDFYHVKIDIPEDQMYELEVKDPDGNMLSVDWMKM